jgi:hypothetical protein
LIKETNIDGIFVHLTREEVMKQCRPGRGSDTCIWLVSGVDGFDCLFFNRQAKNLLGETLEDRWKAGLTVAKRDGCPEIQELKEE